MPVLPKFQLKQLFEAGDLITQTTLDELIEATYNPTLIAGNNITINKVDTPSGTNITISSTGGGGGTVQSAINLGSGQGVFAQLVGSELQFKSLKAGSNVTLTSTATEITINSTSSGSAIAVEDEGTSLTTNVQKFNFTGQGVTATSLNNNVTVNIPSTAVEDEGTSLTTDVQKFNFTGAGVTATAVGNEVTVDVPAGGINFQAGDGLAFDTSTNPDTLNIDLYTDGCVAAHGPNLNFIDNKLNFIGVHIEDEGVSVGTFPVINFTGTEVEAIADPSDDCVVNVFIPPPTFLPYFNQAASTECNCTGPAFSNPRISAPTSEGIPYKTGSASKGFWGTVGAPEGEFHAAYTDAGDGALSFTMVGPSTGFGGDSTFKVDVFDADGTTVLETFTTPAITADNNYTSPSSNIVVFVSNFGPDSTKFKAQIAVVVKAGLVLSDNSLSGGRFNVKFTHTTDTGSDTGSQYFYYGPNGNTIPTSQSYNAEVQDVFFDVNNLTLYPSTPDINGTVTIEENPSNINSKHLSGVEYYTGGSQFMIEVTDIDLFNGNTQGRQGGQTPGSGFNLLANSDTYNLIDLKMRAWCNKDASGTIRGAFTGTNWPDLFNASDVVWDYDNWALTGSNYRFRDVDANASAEVFDPWNTGNSVTSPNAAILIDTYAETGNSTRLSENFRDEEFRLIKGAASYTSWNSTTTLSNALGVNAATVSTTSPAPHADACTVGARLIPAQKFFKDNGSTGNNPGGGFNNLTGSLIPYKPNGGTGSPNPNPDYSGFTATPVYHRLFEASSSSPNNQNRPIASFRIALRGTFPTTGNPFDELVANKLLIYVRKKNVTSGSNIGAAAIPHSVHNGGASGANAIFSNGTYADPPSSIDASDGSASCRTTASAPSASGQYYVIDASFGQGTTQCMDGIFLEIHIKDDAIRLDEVKVKLNFAAGSPASEPSITDDPNWPI